jgi:peptidoglycan hydrolase-like protein with peptidoglycan-binding domain
MDSRKVLLAAVIISAGTAFAAGNQHQATSPSDQSASTATTALNGAMSADPSVQQAQQALKDKGHDPGAIDGIMGPKTESALRDFQTAQGISASGTLDSQTLAALNGSATTPFAAPASEASTPSPSSSADTSAPSPSSSDSSTQTPPSSTQ